MDQFCRLANHCGFLLILADQFLPSCESLRILAPSPPSLLVDFASILWGKYLLGNYLHWIYSVWRCRLLAALEVVPASRVAMDTSSLLIAFGPPPTFKAPSPKLIISDEVNVHIKPCAPACAYKIQSQTKSVALFATCLTAHNSSPSKSWYFPAKLF